MHVNPGAVPPGGWHFAVSPEVTIKTDSLDGLGDMVFAWRLRAGIPPGNVRADIDRYYCSRWPSYCIRDAADIPIPGSADKLSRRVAQGAAILVRQQPAGGFAPVLASVSAARAEVCTACPLNKVWRTGCTSCTASLQSMLFNLRGGRTTPLDDRLFACEVSGRDNTVEVQLPDILARISSEELKFYPVNCWKLSL